MRVLRRRGALLGVFCFRWMVGTKRGLGFIRLDVAGVVWLYQEFFSPYYIVSFWLDERGFLETLSFSHLVFAVGGKMRILRLCWNGLFTACVLAFPSSKRCSLFLIVEKMDAYCQCRLTRPNAQGEGKGTRCRLATRIAKQQNTCAHDFSKDSWM